MHSNIKESVYNYLDSKDQILRSIGLEIWKNPEIGLKEKFAHELLTDIFENEGFQVTRNFILDTGFKAEYKTSEKPHIAYFCEYDALPIIGHACGHNLIAEAGVGGALGLKYAMEHFNVKCKLTVFGSPAEENEGGKITMINKNALKDVDVAMMVHPREINSLHMPHCSLKDLSIQFKGCSAHATASPWEGKNALDAATLTYQGVACYRKQMRSNCNININLKMDPNNSIGIIPDNTIMEADLRAPSMQELMELDVRLKQIVKGAALMADCEFEIIEYEEMYENLVSNKPLLETYRDNASQFDIKFENITRTGGSTDMGNVSHVVPSIHPVFFIGSPVGPHTEEFVKWTGTERAHNLTVLQAKLLAATGIDVALNKSLIKQAQEDFKMNANLNFPDNSYCDLY